MLKEYDFSKARKNPYAAKLSKQITNAVIFDKNGNKYTYTIKTFTPNVKVPESTFAFDSKLYPGVEVVDLR
jgi:outer membrane lipoprotein-sorting protein